MTTPVAPAELVTVDRGELGALCRAALAAAGAGPRVAALLTDAALFAEDCGKPLVGIAHLLDYLHALDDRRVDGHATPVLSRPSPALIHCDARGGIAHTGFDEALTDVVESAHRWGAAIFAQRGSYTCGQLGWFTDRLAAAGLVALATAVSTALMAAGAGTGRVYGTNPLAYSIPRPHQPPLTVDQASSVTALVAVREAAARNEPLPEGWALDAEGQPTTDPSSALTGALLPFGGYKGANIALLVELLSCMAGGNWSLDAPSWDSGTGSPAVGMFVLAVDHTALAPDFTARAEQHLTRLADHGVRVPGGRRSTTSMSPGGVELRADVFSDLSRRASHQDTHSPERSRS